MKTLKTVLRTFLALVLLAVLAALGFVFSGVYNVAATDAHWSATQWLLDKTVSRSVALRADDLRVPSLDGQDMLLEGATSFDAMCAHCHTAPGADPSPAVKGLNPRPPELDHAGEEYSAAELFWITKHGIKMSGMPAWGPTHDDEQLWPVVAFVQALPDMDGQRYQALLETAKTHDAGHHGGEAASDDEADGEQADQDARDAAEGTHDHDREDHAH